VNALAETPGFKEFCLFLTMLPGAAIEFGKGMGKFIAYLPGAVLDYFKGMGELCANIVNALADWINKHFNAGVKYAEANPTIALNTQTLRDYASQLKQIASRVSDIDHRMDHLYHKMLNIEDLFGSADRLFTLLRADILTGYSRNLTKSTDYLNYVAQEFDDAEGKLKSNLSN
jgi:hypothetical protein